MMRIVVRKYQLHHSIWFHQPIRIHPISPNNPQNESKSRKKWNRERGREDDTHTQRNAAENRMEIMWLRLTGNGSGGLGFRRRSLKCSFYHN